MMRSYLAAGFAALVLCAAPVFAQSSPSEQPQGADKPKEKQIKAKKVWTDDDIGELKGVNITTASAAPAPAAEGKAPAKEGGAAVPGKEGKEKEKEPAPETTAKYWKDKLAPKRKQLADAEAKIKQIQDALANPAKNTDNRINYAEQAPQGPLPNPQSSPPTGDGGLYGTAIVRPQDQLAYYQKERDRLQQEIDDLESQAMSFGLSRNDIQD